MNATASIVWFRLDLRLADNLALAAAFKFGGPVVPVFIWEPEEEAPWRPGAASRWWLHQSLAALNASLRRIGSRLIIRHGPSVSALRTLARETRATAVFWNRRYEPAVIARDSKVEEDLRATGLRTDAFNGALLLDPSTIRNKSGRPFQVFTLYWKHCLSVVSPAAPLPPPRELPAPRLWPKSVPLDALELEPKIKWDRGIRAAWHPGEAGARSQLKRFLKNALPCYATRRNNPGISGTSRLSPHLHFGEISPRQLWCAVQRVARLRRIPESAWQSSQFITELGWREFSHYLLYHFPHTPAEPLRAGFAKFSWPSDSGFLKAWQEGMTGFPVVDAGMRELWATGWMRNRVRMIVASFLVKDLLISWQAGARWFWDTLVDADLAQNTLGWQWTAGCGADAAPFFRIFNPVSQAEKFDPHGLYVRRWCPELSKLPDEWLHHPWEAPPTTLTRAGVDLGRNYPAPIVSHIIARQAALEAFAGHRSRTQLRRMLRGPASA